MNEPVMIAHVRAAAAKLREERDVHGAVMKHLADALERSGRHTLSPDAQVKFDAAAAEVERLNSLVEEHDARVDELLKIWAATSDTASRGMFPGSLAGHRHAGTSEVRGRALSMLERREVPVTDKVREAAVRAVEGDPLDRVAELASVTGDPDYLTAWAKVVRNPARGHITFTAAEYAAWSKVDQYERALTVSGGASSAGLMAPFWLEPSIVVTGAGTINPIRRIARIRQTAGPTWNGVSGAQVSASWDSPENSAVSDDTPTLTRISATLGTGRAFIPWSYESQDDVRDLSTEIARLLADAVNVLEGSSFLTGSGTAPTPLGIVTGVNATTASRVACTTTSTYSIDDIYRTQAALPARFSAQAQWLMNLSFIHKTRRFGEGASGSNSAFWSDLAGDVPPVLLGRPLHEASAMASSVTTGALACVYGSFDDFIVADHLGGTRYEPFDNLYSTASGMPTGTRGLMVWWRTATALANADAFRVLVLTA